MVLSDADGVVLMANPAYCMLYGYDHEEIIGHSFAIIFPPEQRPRAIEQYRIVYGGGGDTAVHETWIRRKDGTERFVQARAELIARAGTLERWCRSSETSLSVGRWSGCSVSSWLSPATS